MSSDLWNNVLNTLKNNINKQSYDMWFKDTEILSINNNLITIKAIDEVARRHIKEKYLQKIGNIINNITKKKYSCEILTKNNQEEKTGEPKKIINQNFSETYKMNLNNSQDNALNPRYTFDNFVIGPNNQFAHAAADAVAKSPATQFNPLFVYGESGLGKTHLMQAIGHYLKERRPMLKIFYVPTEQFINEFIISIRTNTQESFKIKYRNVDILMVDDIQFIEKKEETQNEFFHTFNTLYDNKKQIIITSDRPPKQLSTLEDRLRTRFEWGMITDIQPPNLETREAILRNKAEKENINISEEALNYIASHIKSSIRALEAALTRLKMVSFLYKEEISILHAKKHLKDIFDINADKKININDIIKKVTEKYEVTIEDLISKSRHSRIVTPRFIAMYLSRALTRETTSEIGKKFGDRDHSTVVNAVNQIEDNIKKDLSFKETIDDLILELKN